MKIFNSHRHLVFFIGGSLVLLGILEFFWLKKLYTEEQQAIQEQVQQVVRNNILAFQITMMQKSNVRLIDSFFSQQEHDIKGKSALKLFDSATTTPQKLPENIRIFINTDTNLNKKPSRKDTMMSAYAYEFQKFIGNMMTPEELKLVLDTTFKNAHLRFEIAKIKSKTDTPFQGDFLLVNSVNRRSNNADNERFAIAIFDYDALILKKIYPELLFALFVLGMVAISFWLIYRSFLQQKRLIALKNDFISNITHELKTPITTVGVAIEAMRSFDALKNPKQTKEYLDISKNELNRLSLLVDKVLKMAIFEQSKPQLTLETIDLAAMTQQIVKSMHLQFDKYNATVSIEKIGSNFTLNADKTHITSVIYNLIDNALKYGGEKPSIQISLQAPFQDFVRFSVKDNGVGIPPQYQDKIFDKFFRIPTGDVHDTKGHGLGLSYVASVIKQHGGKIQVESQDGIGSTFSVFLPTIKHIDT